MQSVPLSRKFQPIPEFQQMEDAALDDVFPTLGHEGQKVWNDLLDEYRVVILADAGAGKTFELRAAAQRQRDAGKPSFFIRIENIGGNFAEAFEIGTAAEFHSWLDGEGEAWFFLDAVDEIRLTEPRAFEDAIRSFSGKIRSSYQRAHIYLSSRPYAWRPTLDRALVDELLPFDPTRRTALVEDTDEVEDSDASSAALRVVEDAEEPSQPLRLYLLSPLEVEDIRQFAEHAELINPEDFIGALERSAMISLARFPFDLQDLIERWRDSGVFPNRLQMLRDSVRIHFSRSRAVSSISSDHFLEGARFLAIASILTGIPNIRLPGSVGTSAIDPEELLIGWTTHEIKALLYTGVFGEPLFGQVRFRHREVRELLAAEWWAAQLSFPLRRAQLEPLMFRTQYGEKLLVGRLRPIVPWLVLFDDKTLMEVLDRVPEVITEGGDAASLPVGIRRRMLSKLIEQVVDPTSRVRGLDNGALLRIAQRDLEGEVDELLRSYFNNDAAIFVLGRLVWQGRMEGCLDQLASIAGDASRDVYSRIVSARAISSVGTSQQTIQLWQNINAGSKLIPRRLLAELLDYSAPSTDTISLLLGSIGHLEAYNTYEANGLSQSLDRFIDRVPVLQDLTQGGLFEILAGFQAVLVRSPYIQGCRVSADYRWLLTPALRCVERLVTVRSPSALTPTSLWVLDAVPQARYWRNQELSDRKSTVSTLVPAWQELNDILYWWTISSYRQHHPNEEVTNDWSVAWLGQFWSFGPDDFDRVLGWVGTRELAADKLLALSRVVRLYIENKKPRGWLAKMRRATSGNPALAEALEHQLNVRVTPEVRRFNDEERRHRYNLRMQPAREAAGRADFVARLIADPDQIRNPPGLAPGQFSTYQYHLLRTAEGDNQMSTDRARGADWRALIPEFGVEVAETYRDTATDFWKHYEPGLRSEGANANTIPYALVFGMAGLQIEFESEISALAPPEIVRALRYSTWELNGFPPWLERFFAAYPSESLTFFWREIVWELNQTTPTEPTRYMLSDLVYHAPWMHEFFGKLIYEWLKANDTSNLEIIRYCRTIMMNGGISENDLADLAQLKLSDAELGDEFVAIWTALGVDTNPAISLKVFEKSLLSRRGDSRKSLGQLFFISLMGGRTEVSAQFGSYKTPTYLSQLYLLAHSVISASEDIERAGTGVYSPTVRDDAQDARERLVGLLGEIKGELTYLTFLELAAKHPLLRYRDHLRARARQRAVADGDLNSWSVAEVGRFAKRLSRARKAVSKTQSTDDATH